MPYSRYNDREIFLNDNRKYRNVFFKNRDIKETYQYDMPNISYPSPEDAQLLDNEVRVWSAVDTLYNVANDFYGAPEYWWVIAWYNMRATEAEFKVGDQYYIPLPLESVLEYIG